MPGGVPKLTAVVDEGLENRFGRREIDEREPIELDGNQFPKSQDQCGRGEESGAMAQTGAKRGNDRKEEGEGEDRDENDGVGVRSRIEAAVGQEEVDGQGNECSGGHEHW